MGRRELRENTFKLLFIKEFHELDEMREQSELYLDTLESMNEEEKNYVQKRVFDIISHLEQIDQEIDSVAEGWKVNRMGKVDLCIIRLALFELRFDESIPVGVAINEAVEIAKRFGGDDSPAFINGILAKLVIPE